MVSGLNADFRSPEGFAARLPGSIVVGKDGASAYEVAVRNGFEGTEAEWLASLRGDTGVYVGSGEMPEDCNIQIDPEGETPSIVQTVNGRAPDENGNVEIDALPNDTEQLEMLIEADLLPAVYDASGAILTDSNGNIVLRY